MATTHRCTGLNKPLKGNSTGCLVKLLDSFRCSSSFPESYASTLCSCRWPVIVIISDFGTPLAFSFLTTVFWTEWLDNLLSGQISCKGEFSFMPFIILLIVFLPIRLFLYHTSVLAYAPFHQELSFGN